MKIINNKVIDQQRKQLGKVGEELAIRHLKKEGYIILTQNFHSPYGEIDIIAQDKDELVLVEVKTRISQNYGSPEESVTQTKLEKIMNTGYVFQDKNPNLPEEMRVDVIAIELDGSYRLKRLEHLKNVGWE